MFPRIVPALLALSMDLAAVSAAAQHIAPSALLTIDQNRATVVERIVGQWGDRLAGSNAGVGSAQLREILSGLRADHLLAASLAGSVAGLRNVVAGALVHTGAAVSPTLMHAKSLGDTGDDLVYTPIVPCRILDTRNGTTPPYNAQMVGGSAFPVTTNLANFAPQGGSATNCNLPASFQAVVATFTVLNPNFDAFLAASNTSNFATLTQSVVMDFSANKGLANTATVPVDGTVKFYLGMPATVTTHVIADIAGYFKPPGSPLPVTTVTAGTGLAGGGTSGTVNVSIATGGVGNTQLANSAVDVSKLNTTSTDARYFKQGGNAFGATATLGTSDNRSLHLQANGLTSWRIAPTTADPVNGYDTATPNLIGGWDQNAATAGVIGATIGGGGGQLSGTPRPNQVTDYYGTVGGGVGNRAGDAAGTVRDRTSATVGGGAFNTASGDGSTVGGGGSNTASGAVSTVSGGFVNTASGSRSTVGGGTANTASGDYSAVSGGNSNIASGNWSTVGGGNSNTASGNWSTVGGGSDNIASGGSSTVGGGASNTASGSFSFAAGSRAKALGNGSFIWADSSNFDYTNPAIFPNAFGVRATGGVDIVVAIDGSGNPTWRCLLSNGASWSCSSDRNSKENFRAVDTRQVLERVVQLPVSTWNARGADPNVRHMGPTAQDFRAAFGLGHDDKVIAGSDLDGIALAAIQGLHQMLLEKDRKITRLEAKAAKVNVLERKLQAIEAKLGLR